MATVDQTQQDPAAQGGVRAETPEEKAQWRNLRVLIGQEGILPDTTIKLAGRIDKVLLDANNRYFREDRKDAKSGETKPWFHVKVVASITDTRVTGGGAPLTLAPKRVGASFFDGKNKDGSRSPFRGGMYSLHLAATHREPSQALMDQKAAWDTEDYEGKPVLLEMIYLGREEDENSRYFGTKANLRCFLQAFLRDPQHAPRAAADDFADLGGDEREPVGVGASPVAPVAKVKVEDESDEHFD